jgi:anthranilate phosphoribosyltransferase
MKYVAPVRKELGFRTMFNILGPLSNPAGVKRQLLGVADPSLMPLMAGVLKALGSEHVWLVHGEDGSDDVSLAGETRVLELKGGQTREFTLKPEDMGLPRATAASLKGGKAEENAGLMRKLLEGEKGPRRDLALANAACALVVAGRIAFIGEAVKMAVESLDSGAAKRALSLMVQISNS